MSISNISKIYEFEEYFTISIVNFLIYLKEDVHFERFLYLYKTDDIYGCIELVNKYFSNYIL